LRAPVEALCKGCLRARFHFHREHCGVFPDIASLRVCLRAAEVARLRSMLANTLLLAVCILVFGYLVMALLWPEKF
jgi:K+-transporting ATPase KdpF subunit